MLWLLLQRIVAVTLLGGTVGSVASLATLGFVALIARAEQVLIGPLLANPASSTWLPVLGSLLIGGLAVGLLRAWIAPARPQGVANVIGAAHGLDRLLSPAPGLKSALASLLSIGCGASVGQYGPLAHLGGLLGYLSGSVFGGDADRRRIGIACGTAAAISTAFQAPIAGIVFAHEVILRHYSLRAFAPVTLASSAGYILVHFVVGRDLSLTLPDSVFVYAPEYLYFAAIGVLGGALAVVMMRMVHAGERLARASRIPELLRPAAAGLLIALLAWSVPEVLGVGQQVLRDVLDGQYPPYALSLVLVAKLLATALCLGFGFVGGMFGPALLVGVVFGTLCGDFAYLLFEGQHTDLVIYAACGMVAVVSPVIGAPLSAILIIFELTRSYDATTAAMVSAVLSNLVSYRVFGRSLRRSRAAGAVDADPRQAGRWRGADAAWRLPGGRGAAAGCRPSAAPAIRGRRPGRSGRRRRDGGSSRRGRSRHAPGIAGQRRNRPAGGRHGGVAGDGLCRARRRRPVPGGGGRVRREQSELG